MKTRVWAILGSLVLAAAATAAAQSTDVPLEGSRIQIVDTSGSAGRRTYVALHDGRNPMPIPDPTIIGGKAFIGPVGAEPVVELDLPASGWSGSTRRGFKFKSRESSIVTAWLGSGRVRFSARGDGAFPLGAPLGGLGVIVEVGDVRYCGFFGGIVAKDDSTRFQARRAPAPASCPELGPTTTTTSTSTSTSSTTSTTIAPACGLYDANTLPNGSYEGSCQDCSASGCILECRCRLASAPANACFSFDPAVLLLCPSTAIDLSACGAGDIGNDNGNLTCTPSSETTTTTTSSTTSTTITPDCGLYDANALPSGSYGGSCVGCTVTGCSLDCFCPTATAGQGSCVNAPNFFCPPTSLDLATCVAGDIGNDDGELTCPTTTGPTSCGLYDADTLPSGSYEGSCVGCLASDCILECRCPMASAPANACYSIDPEVFPLCPSSAIDLTACGAGDIGNNNGNLSCPAP